MKEASSYFDVSSNNGERFYHGLILGMTASLYNSYIVKSNRESGEGRYDICLEPRDIHKKRSNNRVKVW